MKLAIVGFGHAGRMHHAALNGLADVELVAACDPFEASRQAAAAAGLRTYATLHELIGREDLDAAVICTPPRDHVPATLACLAQGIHVLCEKPLATSSPEAAAMFEAANHHTRLAVASKFRHVAEVRQLRTMIAAGELGDVLTFHVAFRAAVDMRHRWNSQPEQSGGGVIADNGSHVFDVVEFLLGSLARVRAVAPLSNAGLKVEDSAELQIETAAGVIGNADLSWSEPPKDDIYITVHGTCATVAIGWKRSLMRTAASGWQNFGEAYNRDAAHRGMHAAFRDAVTAGGPLWITPAECLAAVAAVEASYRSMRSGCSELIAAAASPALSGTSETAVTPVAQ